MAFPDGVLAVAELRVGGGNGEERGLSVMGGPIVPCCETTSSASLLREASLATQEIAAPVTPRQPELGCSGSSRAPAACSPGCRLDPAPRTVTPVRTNWRRGPEGRPGYVVTVMVAFM